MPLQFHKRIKVLPGVWLNLGKTSASITLGAGPIHRTWSTTGRRTDSVDLPGPLSWRRSRSRTR